MAEKRTASDPKLGAFIRDIREAGDRAAHLTKQLLAFARKQIITPKIVSLNGVVGNSHPMLRRMIGEDIEIIMNLAQDLPAVKIDSNQFEQVLMNLEVNARDAMQAGGRITISTSATILPAGDARLGHRSAGGRFVQRDIADTGAGIAKDVLDYIFEPFFTTKDQGKGTGLGLSTCLGIVEQNGGTIWADSNPSLGATFHVLLPAVGEADDAAKTSRLATLPRGTETILFVEDEPMVRDIGVETLRELGYTVHPAPNGPDALLFVTTFAGSIDIVVTDVVMPHMSGRDLVERVLKLRPGMKILYTTGYSEKIISERGILDPGITLLQKPYTPTTLAARVRQILDGDGEAQGGW